MSTKNSVEMDLGFPVYGLRFVNNNTVLACGGGGEGKNGIPNKITAIRCSFNISDKNRRLQKFREITLPSNEDSPMCIDFGKNPSAENIRYSIFVGCNQSTELIKSMNINNNLRKYVYNDEEHLGFSDAVQFDDSLSIESIGEYPKIVQTARDSSVGALMTSRIPSEIFIFNPETLELNLRFKPTSPSEIKDFHINPEDGGQSLTYVTASFIETISTKTGSLISSSSSADKKTAAILQNYFFSKIRYVNSSKVLVTAAKKNGKGSTIIEYDINLKKVTKEKLVSSKIKGIVAIDVSSTAGLVAVAGNDFSVSLLKLSDLKVVKSYTKLHTFAVTCISFSPNGKKLATGSAANTLNVLQVPSSSGGVMSLIGTLFKYAFITILVGILSIYIQQAHDKGDLDRYIELSKVYGEDAWNLSRHYGKIGLDLTRKHGAEYYKHAHHFGKIAFDVAKDKGIEGFGLLKEKLSKKEDEPPLIYTGATEWAADVEKTTTASTINDQVSQVTRDTHDLTKEAVDLDTDSIIHEATQLVVDSEEASFSQSSIEQEFTDTELPSLSKSSSALSSAASNESPVVESILSETTLYAESDLPEVLVPSSIDSAEATPSVASFISESSPSAESIVSEGTSSVESIASNVVPSVESSIPEASSSVESIVSAASPSVVSFVSEASSSVDSFVSAASPSVESVVSKVAPSVASAVSEASPSIESFVSEIVPSVESIASKVSPSVGSIVSAVSPYVESLVSDVSPSVESIASEVSPSVESIASEVSPSVESIASEVSPSVESLVSEVSPSVESFVSDVSPSVESFVSDVSPSVNSVASEVSSLVESVVSEVTPSFTSVNSTLSDSELSTESLFTETSRAKDSEAAEVEASTESFVSQETDSPESVGFDVTTPSEFDDSTEDSHETKSNLSEDTASLVMDSADSPKEKQASRQEENENTNLSSDNINQPPVVQESSITPQDIHVSEGIIEESEVPLADLEGANLNLTEQEPKEQIQFQAQDVPQDSAETSLTDSRVPSEESASSEMQTVERATSVASLSDAETTENLQEANSSTIVAEEVLSQSLQNSTPSDSREPLDTASAQQGSESVVNTHATEVSSESDIPLQDVHEVKEKAEVHDTPSVQGEADTIVEENSQSDDEPETATEVSQSTVTKGSQTNDQASSTSSSEQGTTYEETTSIDVPKPSDAEDSSSSRGTVSHDEL